MNNEDIVAKLTEHTEKIKVANNRIRDLEEAQKMYLEQQKLMFEMTANIKSLSDNMEKMIVVQEKLGCRLDVLERKPAEEVLEQKKERNNYLLLFFITTPLSIILGTILPNLFNAVSRLMG